MRRLARFAPVLVAVATLLVSVTGSAQVSSSDPDRLHEQLEDARADVERIQGQADSVAEQLASIDEQVTAVEAALSASRQLVTRTQAEIAVLRQQIRAKRRLFDRTEALAVKIAISLYKAGPTGAMDAVLTSKTLEDLTVGLEYSSTVTQEQLKVMVAAQRMETELAVETKELETKLGEAVALRSRQEEQAQHLRELRQAQSMELADLRDRVQQARREADAIAAESARVTAQLAAEATSSVPAAVAAAPSAVGASGFAWPINGAITSGYGPRWGRMHSGIDIDCVTGAPIRASKSGTVVSATYDGSGYGYYTVIDHGGGFATLYAHMSELYVSGGNVTQGQSIGACGSTGASTGDHLHFEVRVNGSPQDPLAYLP